MSRILSLLLVVALVACADAPASGSEARTPVRVASDTTAVAEGTMAVFDRVMATARAESLHDRPIGDIVQSVGLALIGTRYRDGLLDGGEREDLVVDLTAFDCVLFVENVLALARGIAVEDYGFETYIKNLEALRYRGGTLDGYCSRLHYFTDWIYDNAARSQVVNITETLSRDTLNKRLDFMTTHREAYARLVPDSTYSCIVDMEASIVGRTIFHVPQSDIEEVYALLEPGDVVATATHIGGLDVTHTGFVFRSDSGRVGFLHASSTGEVKIADDLATYVRDHNVQIGIIVARPVDPRTVR